MSFAAVGMVTLFAIAIGVIALRSALASFNRKKSDNAIQAQQDGTDSGDEGDSDAE